VREFGPFVSNLCFPTHSHPLHPLLLLHNIFHIFSRLSCIIFYGSVAVGRIPTTPSWSHARRLVAIIAYQNVAAPSDSACVLKPEENKENTQPEENITSTRSSRLSHDFLKGGPAPMATVAYPLKMPPKSHNTQVLTPDSIYRNQFVKKNGGSEHRGTRRDSAREFARCNPSYLKRAKAASCLLPRRPRGMDLACIVEKSYQVAMAVFF
jgi:hypothetical protein